MIIVLLYLIYIYLKDNVGQLCPTAPNEPGQYFLKQGDDKGDHLMVDQDLNVVGVIDWQMERIAPANEAFRPSLVTSDMNALCNGIYGLSSTDRLLTNIVREIGAVKLAHIKSSTEKVRRFILCLEAEMD